MATRNINNKKLPASIIDGRKFLDMLSTISLEEVLILKFRRFQHEKWQNMIALDDEKNKKMYHCHVCKVVQYGDKNLFSHLSGKRHNVNMESVRQLTLDNMASQNQLKTTPQPASKSSADKPSDKPSPKPFPKPLLKPSPQESAVAAATKSNAKNATPANIQANSKPVEVKNKTDLTTEKAVTAKNSDVNESQDLNSAENKTENASSIASKPKVNELPQSNSAATKSVANESLQSRSTNMATKAKPTTNNNNNANQTVTNVSDKNNSASNQKNTQGDEIVYSSNSKTQTTKQSADTLANQQTEPSSSRNKIKEHLEKIPEIVKNPLAGANANKKVISCVPLAQLLPSSSIKSDDSQNTEKIEVINLDDTDPEPTNDTITLDQGHSKESPSSSQGRSEKDKARSEKNERTREFIPALTSDSNRRNQSKTTSQRQVALFESKSDEIVGILGVEYVIKIVKTLNERNPRYQCSLCDVTTDQAAMQCHLVGYNHMLKYCEKHFPTALTQYRQYMANVPEHKVCKVLVPILKKLAIAVEKHHGRGTVFLCYEYTYQKNKQRVVAKAINRKHSSEMIGPSFMHVVDAQEVEDLIENANKRVVQAQPPANYLMSIEPHFNPHYQEPIYYDPNSIQNSNYGNFHEPNSMEMVVDDETHKRMVENFLRDNKHGQSQEHKSQRRVSKRHRSSSNSMERKKRRSMSSEWNVERRSLSPLREGDIWQAYRHMVDQKVRELNVFFELYKGDPEEHPQYQEEWQKFWKRRKDELIAAGINHRTYNYQNEWVLFFNARIEELYNQEVENIKIKCRERLCLPMTNDDLPNAKYHVHTAQRDLDNVSPFPLEDRPDEAEAEEEDDTQNVNVIHVLRLLTAMEDNLGSLGPHITEMLAKALQTQKIHPDKLNSLILTHENCAILETAKEKFTGLVISKILDSKKEGAIKRAIKETNLLLKSVPRTVRKSPNNDINLHRASEYSDITIRKRSADISDKSDIPSSSRLRPIQIESSLGKTELAAKLASTISSQGKTSINRDQLQQIIQVYSMIEKKKRLESGVSTELETFSSSASQSDMPDKPNNPPPVTNYQEPMYENTRSNQNSGAVTYQGLHANSSYYSNNVAAPGGSFYGNSNMMSTPNNFQASGNYLSANVARMNNTNYNNSNIMSNYVNNNHPDVGSNPYNYQKTGGGEFSMNTHNAMRNNMGMPPYYNSNAYDNSFGSKRIP